MDTVYQTWDEVAGYCRKVACSIGRLSLAVFDPPVLHRDPTLPTALAERGALIIVVSAACRRSKTDRTTSRSRCRAYT